MASLSKGGIVPTYGTLGVLYARGGERENALEIAAQLEKAVDTEPAAAYFVGLIECLLGNLESAIDWLEHLERARVGTYIVLGCEASFAPLRSVPRFLALLNRLGLS